MAKIKIGSLLVFLFLGLHQLHSQTYKFKTTAFSVSEKQKDGKFGKWSEFQPATILVHLDTNKNRIIIYSEIIQLFDIVDDLPMEESSTDIVYPYNCKDNNGEYCSISFITRKNQDNRQQLYIKYEDRVIVYNIVNFE